MKKRGWRFHPHQIEVVSAAQAGRDVLLSAPTGAGKTLAGFLPALLDMGTAPPANQLHTLYVSPLKSLAVDVHRNLTQPLDDLGLDIRVETRTGDTPASKKARQKSKPPAMLMTTPESLALLVSYEEAAKYFAHLRYIIVDEVHSLMHSKRGDLLALNLARLATLAPRAQRIGLSATVPEPEQAARFVARKGCEKIITVGESSKASVEIFRPEARMPWSGHMASYAVPEVYEVIRQHRMSIVFVNTRAQAELIFQALWRANIANLRIAIHHGSLERDLRRRVEAQMAAGDIDCVVATSSLDLGIDWAAVDLVVQIGAPKGVSRLLQRIGRSNHRLDEPSKALLVPSNRFEYLECRAALDAIDAGELDGTAPRPGGLDVLAQHIIAAACSAPFKADELYQEVITSEPYSSLSRADFDRVLQFACTGGYALKAYDQYARLTVVDGRYAITSPKVRQQYRMNIGTIVESHSIKVKLGNRTLGKIEEWFIHGLSPGDTFVFGGQMLRYDSLSPHGLQVSRSKDSTPKIPTYAGGRMPLSTALATRVRGLLVTPQQWDAMPGQVADWLHQQHRASAMPSKQGLLVESFARKIGRRTRHYLVTYPFEGRNAHQTLGFLLLRRVQRLGAKPLGFVATDYGLALWSMRPIDDASALFHRDLMADELQEWLDDTPLLKKNFRDVAVISGLIARQHPGHRKTGKQVSFNSDLLYDVLRKYEPDHILLQAARADAYGGLIDLDRLADMLIRVDGHITHRHLERVSPMALPLILEISRESINREQAADYALEELEADLLKEAGLA